MEFFTPGRVVDFMKYRKPVITASIVMSILSLASLFFPGPNLGTDFAGGTELQLRFRGSVSSAELRGALAQSGFRDADVIGVQGGRSEYIVRVREVSAISGSVQTALEQAARSTLGATNVRVSPGGDKISLRLADSHDLAEIQQVLTQAGARVRSVNAFGSPEEHKYEAHLVGIGDEIVTKLQQRLGDKAPRSALRVEWVGPRAGQQLRDAAVKSLIYAMVFIMVYVAFRFDLRFAPGGIVALVHDVMITIGAYVLVRKEVGLTTVAALLTILGYSINDTIVVYDRIRENLGRHRGKSLREIINISTSETLGRTIMTSATTVISIVPFLIFGTSTVKDIAFALVIGIGIGTYSSIYIAAPVTEFIDRRFYASAVAQGSKKPAGGAKA